MTDTALAVIPRDPAKLGYPPTLPLEIALRENPVKTICESWGIDKAEWDRLRQDPAFIADLAQRVEDVKKDGVSFKVKAQLQAEQLLETSWEMIHDVKTPHAVKADMIKFTVRAAGLDGSKDQAANQGPQNALQINIQLG